MSNAEFIFFAILGASLNYWLYQIAVHLRAIEFWTRMRE